MTTYQTEMLLGMGISQALVAICPKGLIREAVTWTSVALALACLAVQTVFAGHHPLG
jgi:hypothetical protein